MEKAPPVVALRKESVDRNIVECNHESGTAASLSARRAWIEIYGLRRRRLDDESLSARRAWIEIKGGRHAGPLPHVALRKESVDRNYDGILINGRYRVALRKESVDRNLSSSRTEKQQKSSLSARRAWIEIWAQKPMPDYELSLSARRAWIEIQVFSTPSQPSCVALRKESVDRNPGAGPGNSQGVVALRKESVDRNSAILLLTFPVAVALRKESVDRNINAMQEEQTLICRSPQGERG